MAETVVIVSTVENLSMTGAKPVEILLMKIISRGLIGRDRAMTACARRLRDPLRLIAARSYVRSTPLFKPSLSDNKHVIVHRFDETIGGRAYQIEVTPVGNRWRAQLRRSPGMPTAMMPFYGQTPDAAAHELAKWLEVAHRRSHASTV